MWVSSVSLSAVLTSSMADAKSNIPAQEHDDGVMKHTKRSVHLGWNKAQLTGTLQQSHFIENTCHCSLQRRDFHLGIVDPNREGLTSEKPPNYKSVCCVIALVIKYLGVKSSVYHNAGGSAKRLSLHVSCFYEYPVSDQSMWYCVLKNGLWRTWIPAWYFRIVDAT